MLKKLKTKDQKGFTIIEVLIVLAIAGLILLIVFLAVPALQRNSRNTQRKNDVQNLIGALQEYTNNNAGALPADNTTYQSSVLTNTKLGFYNNSGDVVYAKNTSAVTTTPTATEKVTINTFAKCNGNALATSGATSRSVAAVYYIETSSSTQAQCVDM